MSEIRGTDGDGRRGAGRVSIVVAILVVGAMTAGAMLFVSSRDQVHWDMTTTSAQVALVHAKAGWHCETEREGLSQPIGVGALEVLAEGENGPAGAQDVFESHPVRCTLDADER